MLWPFLSRAKAEIGKCFRSYDWIGTPRFSAGKTLGDDAGNSPGKMLPESPFEGLALFLR